MIDTADQTEAHSCSTNSANNRGPFSAVIRKFVPKKDSLQNSFPLPTKTSNRGSVLTIAFVCWIHECSEVFHLYPFKRLTHYGLMSSNFDEDMLGVIFSSQHRVN